MSNKTKGNLALLLTAMVWGTGFIGQRIGNQYMPPIAFNATRQLMAAVVLCPVALIGLRKSGYLDPGRNTQAELNGRRRKLATATFVCGIFLFLGTTLQQIGLVTVSAGKSGFITSIYIALVPLLSVIFGGKVRLRTVLCIALALFGFGVMSLKEGFSSITTGDWLTLLSALFFSAQIVAINHFVDDGNAIALSVTQLFLCGIAGLAVSMFAEQATWAGFTEALPVLLYMTFVPTAVGYTLQIVGQNYTEPSIAALIMSLEAVFAALFGALILGEMMTLREAAGCVIIFIATILGQMEPRKKA